MREVRLTSKAPTKTDVRHIQFDVSPKMREELDVLVERSGARTRGETVRKAVRLYSFMLNEMHGGSRIQSIAKDGTVTQVCIC